MRADAPGYQAHTSPIIQVINEIVHYNIPLRPDNAVFLPLLRK